MAHGLHPRLGALAAAAPILAAALCAPAPARAQAPTDASTTQTTGTQTVSATSGIDDKTYISSGAETAISASNDIQVRPNDVLSVEGLLDLRAPANQPASRTPLDVKVLTFLQRQLGNPRPRPEERKHLFEALPGLFNRMIAPGPQDENILGDVAVPAGSVLSKPEYEERHRRIVIEELGAATGLWTIRRNPINVLLAGDALQRADLIQFRGVAQIRRDIKALLPPVSLLSGGLAVRMGRGAPLYMPDVTYSSAIEGYDVSLQGIAGGASGAGFTFRKDLAAARLKTARLLAELYDIVDRMPSETQVEDQSKFKDICNLLHAIAEEYPRMQLGLRVAASASYRYLDSAPIGGATHHYSIAAANLSASWLRPLSPRGTDPATHTPVSGIGALAGVQQFLVAPSGAASSTSTRVGGALFWQDKVPYYDEVPIPAPTGTNLLCPTGYRFDHWNWRLGAETSWDTALRRDAAWDVFVKRRTLRAQRPAAEAPRTVEELIRGDTILTFAFGRGFDRSDTFTFRIDQAF